MRRRVRWGLETSPTRSPVAADVPSSSSAGADDTNTNQQGDESGGKCSQEQQQESSSQATVGLASFAAGAVFAAGLAIYMSARRRRRDGRILPSGDLTYDLEMT
jgi:phosphotransferase system  glucose/maltose/N-acetylglucosamine-specific IIC component